MSSIKQVLRTTSRRKPITPAQGIGVCYEYPDPADRRRKLIFDPRAFKDEDGFWHVLPFAFTEHQVHIVCPYCGQVHYHGKEPGHRIQHCRDSHIGKRGYVIEEWEKKNND